ncbi:MAG TPA: nucleoside transporter C-terminal domain-containing protein [Gemmatimonadaceae bacterium]|jgi:CNT family concentrative nucleoside transporter|nr:NupC/NupG family nucleoside CNT transporter [Gemmatimonadota bacterium]HNV73710.1 nucleoside transporter C-terminal domain-containing protein [Gemmatimonadaceae bacterium]MBK7832968.1 NupC/NupG family nucleoside CNT transporter [Gemmatimonadota bacterium]MBK8057106.1 NupC/NupG family nucleoside CNT transporter [Gemmatimonadota bacterium]MBK8649127.1 NupC/NupG family nucleoside CNT transporter [Gemmatimonadota bacterium]
MPLLRLRSLVALILLVGVCWALSRDRKAIAWRVVLWGVALQVLFGMLVLLTPVGTTFFAGVNNVLLNVMHFAESGAKFLFGDLIFNNIPVGPGTPGGNAPITPGATVARTGAYFAFHVLPTIIFFSSLMAVLYHLKIMQRVVHGVAWVMQRTMGTSGAETLATAGGIFVGLMETPLLVRPYLERMTRSEVFALMVAGLASISGGLLVAYVGLLSPFFPDIGGHLVSASFMSAPAALAVAKLLFPETEGAETSRALPVESEQRHDVNLIDAAGRGANEGLFMALKVGAMLIAFLSLLEMANAGFGWMGRIVGFEHLTLQGVLGVVMSPVAWIIGVPWTDARIVGELIGVKTILNEFVAYRQLADHLQGAGALQQRSVVLASYALAGFANFGSIAMQIAGMGELAPGKRTMLAELGMRALLGGAIAGLMTAAVAGLVLP